MITRVTPLLVLVAVGACGWLEDPCEGFDEEACVTADGCVPLYGPDGEFRACGEGEACGPVCDIWCEYGNVIDENGCATCACNPPPSACEGLSERQCLAAPGCEPVYVTDVCVCGDCEEGVDCPPCECPPPTEGGYAGCHAVSRCANLDELTCAQTPGCAPMYGPGACPPCLEGEECPPCDWSEYLGCYESEEACWSDADCGAGEICEYRAYEDPGCVCPACIGPDCECDCARPAPHGVCVPSGAWECYADADCPEGYACAIADCACFCDEPDCAPCDCGGGGVCYPVEPPPPAECYSDADCGQNGYCDFLDCPCDTPPDCPYDCANWGVCVYPSCDDGSELYCEMEKPLCAEGEIAAVINHCWQCVDARTCADPACPQVITYAADPSTGTCYAFATPCDVPAGWGACTP